MKKYTLATLLLILSPSVFGKTPAQVFTSEQTDESLRNSCQVYEKRVRYFVSKKSMTKEYYKSLREIPDLMSDGDVYEQVFKFKKQRDWNIGAQLRIGEINQAVQGTLEKSFLTFAPSIVDVEPLVIKPALDLAIEDSALLKVGDDLGVERLSPEFEESPLEYRLVLRGRDMVCDFLSKRVYINGFADLAVQYESQYVEKMRAQRQQALAIIQTNSRSTSKFERAARQGIALYRMFYEQEHRNGRSDQVIIAEVSEFFNQTINPLTGDLIGSETESLEKKFPFEGVLQNERLEFHAQ